MSTVLETIQQEVWQIRRDVAFLRHVVEEDCELSDEACQELKAAKKRMAKGEYMPHEQVMKQYG